MTLAAIRLDKLSADEVSSLTGELSRQAISRGELKRLEKAIQAQWITLTRHHPGLERFTQETLRRERPGTQSFHRAFLGGFPDLPSRPLRWTDEELIYGAFNCVSDHASVSALLAVLKLQ